MTEAPVGLLGHCSNDEHDHAFVDQQPCISHRLHGAAIQRRHKLDHADQYTFHRARIRTPIPALPANTLYYYRVQANNGTLYSNVDAAMTQPPAPSNLTASYNASNSERDLELDSQRFVGHRLRGRCFHRRRRHVDHSIRRHFFEFVELHRHRGSRTWPRCNTASARSMG